MKKKITTFLGMMAIILALPTDSAYAAESGISYQGTKTIVETYEFEKIGDTVDFSFQGAPTDWATTCRWISSNEEIVVVDNVGVVTAVAEGTATVSVIAGADESYVETVTITVGGGFSSSDYSNKRVGYTIYVGENQTFTTIKSALEFANKNEGTTIYVLEGTYDIVEEYGGTLYGMGMYIGNSTRMIFSPRAYVECNYVGSDSNVMLLFSPFNAGTGDFEIEGLNLTCKNVRYCFHDELGGAEGFNTHIFRNCHMYIDNTESVYFGNFNQCIGGGLGKDSRIIIEGGSYESKNVNSNLGTISYHNGDVADACSEIIIKDVYFVGNDDTVRFGWYGASTEITRCYVSNCSFGKAPIIRSETGKDENVNMELITWNNEIRAEN